MRNLAIKDQQGRTLSLGNYRTLFLSNKKDPYTVFLKVSVEIQIMDNLVKEKLFDFFQTELDGYVRNGKFLPCISAIKGGPGRFSLDLLIRSLCRISIMRGIKTAISVFEKTVTEDQVFFQDMIVLDGLKINREIQLFDGVKLIPLPDSPSKMPNFVPDSDGYPFNVRKQIVSKTLLIIDCSVSPAFYKFGVHFEFNQSQTNKTIGEINNYEFCMILALASNSLARPLIKWIHVDEKELFFYECGNAGHSYSFYETTMSRFENSIPVSDIETQKFTALYQAFLDLDIQEKQRFTIAIPRWIESKTDKSMVNKMIDLGIAFELLYLDNNNAAQLSYTFRIRVAWHLGKNAKDRKRLLALCKTIYDCRSKAVHTARLQNRVEVEGKKIPIEQFIEQAQDLCHQSMLKIIRDGKFPDWDSVVVGENAT